MTTMKLKLTKETMVTEDNLAFACQTRHQMREPTIVHNLEIKTAGIHQLNQTDIT
jgi:hypothetical protein